MTIHHHLNDATLMAYAAGSVSESLSFVIATHLSVCSTCRARVAEMESLGGAELESQSEMTMSSTALDNVMALLDDDFFVEESKISKPVANSNIPSPLRDYLPHEYEALEWKTMAPGVKYFTLDGVNAGKGTLRLLKIAPGVTIPEHTHEGTELTLVLKGSFSDEVGRFMAGDIADLDDDIHHQPIADTDEDCICLIVTEAPLKFKAMMPKLFQYFVGM
jgi:putative transcriptional regulator